MITVAAKCLQAWAHSTCQTSAQYKSGTSLLCSRTCFSGRKGGQFFFLDLVLCLMENVFNLNLSGLAIKPKAYDCVTYWEPRQNLNKLTNYLCLFFRKSKLFL